MSNTSARAKLRAEQEKQRKKERQVLIGVAIAIVLAVVAAGGGFLIWRANQTPSAGPSTAVSPTPVTLTDGQPITFGSSSAPAKIALYVDFHCPHCAEFEESYQAVIDQAVREKKAAVSVYPLAFIDQGSAAAANAFACSAQAGFGQTYYNALFANHTLQWNDNQLIDLMGKVSGAPASGTFEACVKQKQSAAWVQSVGAVATQKNVTSTPTMFLNDAPVDIATLTPDTLQAKIDQAGSR